MSSPAKLLRYAARVLEARSITTVAETSPQLASRDVKPFHEIPTPPGLPFVGNLPSLMKAENRRDPVQFFRKLKEQYGDIYRLKLPGSNNYLVIINKSEDTKTLLAKEGRFPNIPAFDYVSEMREGPLMSKYKSAGLMTNGESWGQVRKSVQQDLMRPKSAIYYIDHVEDVLEDFFRSLEREMPPDRVPLNLDHNLKMYAFESIAVMFLGAKSNVFDGDARAIRIMDNVDYILNNLLPMTFLPRIIFKINGVYYKMLDTMNEVYDVCNELVQEAAKKIEKDESLKETVLAKLISRNGKDSTLPVLMSIDALSVGLDTTGTSGTILLYHLASNPEKQERLYQEICEVIGPHGKMTEEALAKMRYLKACQIESQRILPVTQGLMRKTTMDIELAGYQIPANTQVLKINLVSSLDPTNFAQPDLFLPERWVRGTKEHAEKSSQGGDLSYASLPFGHGKRACIGQRFARLEIQMLAAKVVQRYRLEFVGNSFDLDYSGALGVPTQKTKIRFMPRH